MRWRFGIIRYFEILAKRRPERDLVSLLHRNLLDQSRTMRACSGCQQFRQRSQFRLEPLCRAEQLGVINFYALARGFLTGKYRSEADLGKSTRRGVRRCPQCGQFSFDRFDPD